MSGRRPRTGRVAAGIALAGAVAVAIAAFVLQGSSPGQPFPPLTPKAAPAGWSHLALPNGTAVLSYPPTTHPVAGDRDAVSVAERGRGGAIVLYLNATPRQSDESLRNWATFRLSRLTADDASSAHKDSAATGVKFRGGTGSCVMDDYITRVGAHHYQEIACLVQGRTGASVIVAAALAAQWKQARPVLQQAVAAYAVR
ncbi:MAG: hypothetical protein ACM3ML_00600 [Micromonosporaceae bacterium]